MNDAEKAASLQADVENGVIDRPMFDSEMARLAPGTAVPRAPQAPAPQATGTATPPTIEAMFPHPDIQKFAQAVQERLAAGEISQQEHDQWFKDSGLEVPKPDTRTPEAKEIDATF